MSEPKFGYGEALALGWERVRKYWLAILLLSVCYVAVEGVRGGMEMFAGKGQIEQQDLFTMYTDNAQRQAFYKYLQEAGYITAFGSVTPKLQDMKFVSQVEEPSNPDAFQFNRYRVYKFLDAYRYRLPFPRPVYFVFVIGFFVLGLVMSIGWVKVLLKLVRDQEPDVSELFTNWQYVISYLLGSLCYALAVLGGLVLLIIPGIIFMIMFSMYTWLIVDKDMGPIQALNHSRAITKGSRGRLCIFGFICLLVNLAGLLCLIVGVAVTIWITMIASAYVYDRLANASSEPSPEVLPPAPAAPMGPSEGLRF